MKSADLKLALEAARIGLTAGAQDRNNTAATIAQVALAIVAMAAGATNPDIAFINAVANNTPAFPTVTTAMKSHLIVDAMYRSAKNNGATETING